MHPRLFILALALALFPATHGFAQVEATQAQTDAGTRGWPYVVTPRRLASYSGLGGGTPDATDVQFSATSRLLGRITSGAGAGEELTASQGRTLLELAASDSPTFLALTANSLTSATGQALALASLDSNANITLTPHGTGLTTTNKQFRITDSTASSSVSTGAFVVNDHFAVGGSGTVYGDGVFNLTNSTATSSASTGALIVSGGIGLSGGIFATSDIKTNAGLQSNVGGFATAATNGLHMRNLTAATVGTPGQYSPAILQQGTGWKTDATAATRTVSFRQQIEIAAGAAEPVASWVLASDINSGGYGTRLSVYHSGNVRIGNAAIATNATDGFLFIPSCAGTPTGTPTTLTGGVPIVVDSTNNKLYFYSGGAWRDAGP